MKTSFTPGPWHWEADAVKGDPYGRIRYQVTAVGKTITRVYYSSFEGSLTNAEQDARLIAAAPDLLEALQEIIGWVPGRQAWHTDAPIKAVERAHAAIAKAIGD